MYDIEFRNLIKTASGISNVHFGIAPDNTQYPLITIQTISSQYDYSQDGLDVMNSMVYQIDVWTTSYSAAFDIGNKLIDGCDLFASQNYLKAVFVTASRNDVDTSTSTKLFRYSIDVEVFYVRKN